VTAGWLAKRPQPDIMTPLNEASVRGAPMAVDRLARDKLTKTLIDYMAGRIRSNEFDDNIGSIKTKDSSVRECVHCLSFWHEDCVEDEQISATHANWSGLLQVIAFLRSDLEMPRRAQGAGRIGCLCVLLIPMACVGLIIWLRTGAIWLALGLGVLSIHPFIWIPSVLGGLFLRAKSALRTDSPPEEDEDLWPFDDKAQWESHKHLVAGLGLPEYDPQVHRRPIRPHGGWSMHAINAFIAVGIVTLIAGAVWRG